MLKFRTWLENADQERMVMYHVTPSKNVDPDLMSPVVQNILEHGLKSDANPKKWSKGDFFGPSLQSYGGVYLTTKLDVAKQFWSMHARQHESAVIVAAEVQPRSLVADEDWIHPYVSNPGDYTNDDGPIHDMVRNAIYPAVRERYVNRFVERAYQGLMGRFRDAVDPRLEKRVKGLLEQAFDTSLRRKAAYTSTWNLQFPKPEPQEAEKEYAMVVDQLTKTLKNIVRPLRSDEHNDQGYNGRSLKDIGKQGSNHIIAVVEAFPNGVAKVHYGRPPGEMVNDVTRIWRIQEWD